MTSMSPPTPQPHHATDHTDHDDEGYRGPATLTVDGTDHEVTLRLLGHFQPIDGYYHWYGRVEAHDDLHAQLDGKRREVRVTTRAGSADGEVSDRDPWGRYRLTGTSTPPFAVGD